MALHLLLLAWILLNPADEAPMPPSSERAMTVVMLQMPAAKPAASAPSAAPAPPQPQSKPKPARPSPKPAAVKAPAPSAPGSAKSRAEPPAPAAPIARPATAPSPSAASADPAPAASGVAKPAQGIAPTPAYTPSQAQIDELERQYAMLLSRLIRLRLNYPAYSRQFGETGTAIVRLGLARDGSVKSVSLHQPTGYRYLDAEAQAVMQRVGRFPPVPAMLRRGQQEVVILQPVTFGRR